MCNHYRNFVRYLQNWEEYVSWNLPPVSEEIGASEEVYPKRNGLVIREGDEGKVIEAMHWGLPWTGPGKRPNTTRKNR